MKRILVLSLAALVFAAPIHAANKPVPAVPKGNPGAWLETEDYPPSALREEAEGVVRFVLDIDAGGVPVNCTVTQSSGRADLDEAACRAIKERARFEPAKDSRGRPVFGTYSNTVRWQIPKGNWAPMPGESVMSLVIEKDGTVSSCTVEKAEGMFAGSKSEMCDHTQTYEPILDAEGNPVRKRLRTTLKFELEDLP